MRRPLCAFCLSALGVLALCSFLPQMGLLLPSAAIFVVFCLLVWWKGGAARGYAVCLLLGAVLGVGIMKTKVPLSNLRAPDKMEKRKPAEPHRSTRVQLDKSRKASMEINLLGYTVDEALNEVDKFLDSGMLRGQTTLYIIHGNGTGALRTAIQKHLRTHKAVKSFRPGRYGEGENGVTVVELK